MNALFAIMLGLGAFSGFSLLVFALHRIPQIGFGLLALSFLTLWEVPNPNPLLSAFGLQIYLNDVTSIAMGCVGLLASRRLKSTLGKLTLPWVVLGLLIAFSLVRGLVVYGSSVSVNEGRPILWFYLAVSWALSLDWSGINTRRLLLIIGSSLTLLATYHAVVYGLGSASSVVQFDGSGQTGRILVASQAFILALCSVPLLVDVKFRGWLMRLAGLVFGVIAFASQHRSVWIAMIVGIIAVLVLGRGSRFRVRLWGILLAAGTLFLLISSEGLLGTFGQGITEAVTDSRSLDARTTSWVQLVEQSFLRGPFDVLFGQPFGSGYARIEPNGLLTTYSPHNWYVQLFLRVGAIGLAMWCIVLIGILFRSMRTGVGNLFNAVALTAYGLFYSIPWFACLWIGAIAGRGVAQGGKVIARVSKFNYVDAPSHDE